MARQRRIRDEAPLPDDATRNVELFGYYGLSLWATSAEWPVDRVLAEKGQRAARAALFTAGGLRDKGLGLVPSGRAPHYDTTVGDVYGRSSGSVQITAPSADDLVDRLISATYTLVENHHYKPDAG